MPPPNVAVSCPRKRSVATPCYLIEGPGCLAEGVRPGEGTVCVGCGVSREDLDAGRAAAAPPPPVPAVRTLAQLRDAFAAGTLSPDDWRLCVDPGGCHLRHVGPDPDGLGVEPPVRLALPASPWGLLAEALNLAGIPAEQA
jgi:hypothetical protein